MKPVRHRRFPLLVNLGLILAAGGGSTWAHDVPDRFFDRSIQVMVGPDKLSLSYQLSLTQLTLAEELLALVGPGGLANTEPGERLSRYADEMGPLIARGLMLRVDGVDAPVRFITARSVMEDHPRFAFEFEVITHAGPNDSGSHLLNLEDTNFFLEKGCVRIAIRVSGVCEIIGSTVPLEVEMVQVRPSWQMTPEQQDEARRAEASWRVNSTAGGALKERDSPSVAVVSPSSNRSSGSQAPPALNAERSSNSGPKLLALLDRDSGGLAIALLGLAFFFGAAHALTPGHGKTMVAAYLIGERGTMQHAVGLGLTTSLTHTGSVLVVAVILALISPALERKIHTGFSLLSGLLVAGLGAWLLVIRLRQCKPLRSDERKDRRTASPPTTHHSPPTTRPSPRTNWGGLVTLGISGGLVPCWDAVALLLFAAAQGQLSRAFFLLLSFSAGLAGTLVAVGVLAVQFRGFLSSRLGSGRIVQSLPVLSAAAICAVGLYLCALTLRTPAATATLTSTTARWTTKP